jgi:hypothetical protein
VSHQRNVTQHHAKRGRKLVTADQRHRRPRRHRRTSRSVPQAVGHVGRQRRRDAQPSSHRASAENPASRGEPSPASPSNSPRPARPPSAAPATPSTPPHHAPHQIEGVLIRRHRCDRRDPDHRPRRRPPDDPVGRAHRAPLSSANSQVKRYERGLLGAASLVCTMMPDAWSAQRAVDCSHG